MHGLDQDSSFLLTGKCSFSSANTATDGMNFRVEQTKTKSCVEEVLLFNKLVPVRGKQTNIAIWCPASSLAGTQSVSKRVRYYLRHEGVSRKVNVVSNSIMPEKVKLCVLMPGFNGGPFDLYQVAESLAQKGYWVISAGCYIDRQLSSASRNVDVAAALDQVYIEYQDLLDIFRELTRFNQHDDISSIRYISFSSGIYPILNAIRSQTLPDVEHDLILLSPGLSNTLEKPIGNKYLKRMLIVHSRLDQYAKFGCPLNYLKLISTADTTLHLLGRGLHFDFVSLPKDDLDHTRGGISAYGSEVKNKCINYIDSFTNG